MKYWEIVDPGLRGQIKDHWTALTDGDQVQRNFEYRFVRKNGISGWCDMTIGRLRYKGRPATVIIAFDITQRKLAEIALRESEEKFRVLSETSPAAIFMYHEDKLIYGNPAAERFTGFTHEELLRKNFWDMVHPRYRDMVKTSALPGKRVSQCPIDMKCNT